VRILIVEDEQHMATGLKFNFEAEGYEVTHVVDGPSALRFFEPPEDDPSPRETAGGGAPASAAHGTMTAPRGPVARESAAFDVVILDLMLPGMSGYETCRRIRVHDPDIPILVLSARSLAEDRAMAFDCGTDQYVTKPFDLRELLSRVRNLMNRRQRRIVIARRAAEWSVEEFRIGEAVLNVRTYELTRGDETTALTSRELELLRYFIDNEGAVLSRSQILRDVWGESPEIATRSIDNFVLRLRKLIEPDPSRPRHILSVRGAGYRFLNEPESTPDSGS
jgi:two-component system OmpR family response regulator